MHSWAIVSTDHRSLVAWQLARELRSHILKLTSTGPASRDERFRSNTDDAAGSVCRNLREGFYRFNPGEFLNFTRYAQASLAEVGEQLEEGVEREYWTDADTEPAQGFCRRTGAAIGRLRQYLMSPEARENAAKIRSRSQRRTRTRTGTPGTAEPEPEPEPELPEPKYPK
jgi:four helix bundle protein